jgi:uncharacterized protein involved in outer membrane biogenesis
MRIRTALLIVVGLVVAVVVIGGVVLFNLDFNVFKEQIAAEAKKATGRELTIKGDLKLNLFTLSPGLAVEDVRFANARWGSRKDMARIKRFEVKVAVMPLLSGTLDVKRVVLSGADVLVERDKRGRGNYEFKPATPVKPKTKAKKKATKTADDGAAGLPALSLREVTVEDAMVTYRDARSGQKLTLRVDSMTVHGGTSEPLEIDIKGSYNRAPFKARGRVGALSALVTPEKTPWPVALTAEAGGATVSVQGSIKRPAEAAGLDLRISVEGKDMSELAPLAGAPVPPLGPYSVSVRVLGSPDRAVNLRDLVAKIGDSGVRGRVDLALRGKPQVTAVLNAELIDLADFVKPSKSEAGKGGAAKTPKAAAGKRKKRLFPADPLPLDGLNAANAKVDVTVKKFLAQGVSMDNLEARVNLRNGNLKLAPLAADVSKGTVKGTVQLDASGKTPALTLALKGKKIDIGKLLDDLEITDVVSGSVDTDLNVSGRGKSVRQIMAGLNGRTQVVMGKGQMKSDALELYGGGAARIATQALFGKQSEYTVINCFVNRFDVKNGLATSKAMLFDTDHATIWGKGTINLATEGINYEVDPRPKKSNVTTAVPVNVGGTLADPSFKVNPLATAAKVTGLLGTILGKSGAAKEPAAGAENPCVNVLKTGSAAPPKSTQQAQPAKKLAPKREDVEKEVKKTLEKGLKSLFGR